MNRCITWVIPSVNCITSCLERAKSKIRLRNHIIINSQLYVRTISENMSFQYYDAADHAEVYNKFRPKPPEGLGKNIVQFITEKISSPLEEALDIGCGGGQSTEILAPYFKKVQGFDPSDLQINEAQLKNKFQNLTYRVGYAEKIDVPDSSVQLVTASQACHWFDLPKFYAEVERVLVPNGVLALYGYLLPEPKYGNKRKELHNIVEKYYTSTLGDYVLPQSKKVYLDSYKGDEFCKIPFIKEPIIRVESLSVVQSATVYDLVGYVQSWSAFQNYLKQEGEEKALNILHNFEKEIMDIIGTDTSPSDTHLEIQFNYFLQMGRKM